MKKTLALLLAFCMAVSLTACGNGSSNAGSQTAGNSQNSGKTDLVIAVDADIDTLHPSDSSTTVETCSIRFMTH